MKLPFLIILLSAFLFSDNQIKEITKTISQRDETKVNVNIEFDAGKLVIDNAIPNIIFNGELHYTKYSPEIEYYIENKIGQLFLRMAGNWGKYSQKKGFSIESLEDLEDNIWYLNFSDQIPMSFYFDIGAAETDLNFTGIKTESFELHIGASKTEINFSNFNTSEMTKMKIETGFSKFIANNLLNANFEKMTFSGQVGDYNLHFGGELSQSVSVSLDISVGSLNLLVPNDAPFRLKCDKSLFSSLDIESASEHTDGYWYSSNYEDHAPYIDFQIDAGIGAVSLHLID